MPYIIADAFGMAVPQEFVTIAEAERALDNFANRSDQPCGLFVREATEHDHSVINMHARAILISSS
jgi:hypothetical protein